MPTHGSGPMWIAIPSSQWTCTPYSLPAFTGAPEVKNFAPKIHPCRFQKSCSVASLISQWLLRMADAPLFKRALQQTAFLPGELFSGEHNYQNSPSAAVLGEYSWRGCPPFRNLPEHRTAVIAPLAAVDLVPAAVERLGMALGRPVGATTNT
jgi:hypothetical protein